MRRPEVFHADRTGLQLITPPCPVYRACGGCQLQDVRYDDQLQLKQRWLTRLLTPFDPPQPIPIAAAPDPWRYRNRAELSFGSEGGALTLGYHAAGSFSRIVDIDDCLLLPELVAHVSRSLRELAAATGLPAYYQGRHDGFFRHAVIRINRAMDQLLVMLVTAPGDPAVVERLLQELRQRHPQIASAWWGMSEKLADIAVPDQLRLLAGAPTIADRIGPFQLQIHPRVFLQPSPAQAERLYDGLLELTEGVSGSTAWDLYCGMGLISLYLSRRYRRVYGIDIDADNLALARQNAQANGVTNAEFREGPAEDVLADKRFWLLEAKPDLIVVDPPRSGLHERVITSLLSARPKHIAYISCNPQSLARDLAVLCRHFPRYRLAAARAYDLFPKTRHLEALILLER